MYAVLSDLFSSTRSDDKTTINIKENINISLKTNVATSLRCRNNIDNMFIGESKGCSLIFLNDCNEESYSEINFKFDESDYIREFTAYTNNAWKNRYESGDITTENIDRSFDLREYCSVISKNVATTNVNINFAECTHVGGSNADVFMYTSSDVYSSCIINGIHHLTDNNRITQGQTIFNNFASPIVSLDIRVNIIWTCVVGLIIVIVASGVLIRMMTFDSIQITSVESNDKNGNGSNGSNDDNEYYMYEEMLRGFL